MIIIGIDPGEHTGIGTFDTVQNALIDCKTLKMHTAFEYVLGFDKPFVRVEDARLRKWFGKNSVAKAQGAGAIKIQCTIWESFLIDMKKRGRISGYEMIKPVRGGTKLDPALFKKITKYTGRTSNHARDAAMIAFGYKPISIHQKTKKK